jgi:hypothetical protein
MHNYRQAKGRYDLACARSRYDQHRHSANGSITINMVQASGRYGQLQAQAMITVNMVQARPIWSQYSTPDARPTSTTSRNMIFRLGLGQKGRTVNSKCDKVNRRVLNKITQPSPPRCGQARARDGKHLKVRDHRLKIGREGLDSQLLQRRRCLGQAE